VVRSRLQQYEKVEITQTQRRLQKQRHSQLQQRKPTENTLHRSQQRAVVYQLPMVQMMQVVKQAHDARLAQEKSLATHDERR
jgi:hypothetical protein